MPGSMTQLSEARVEKPRVKILVLGETESSQEVMHALRAVAEAGARRDVLMALDANLSGVFVLGLHAAPPVPSPFYEMPKEFKPNPGGRRYEAPGHRRHKKGKNR